MAGRKRPPVSDINHENWDQDEEQEEVGAFKQASPEEIKRRIFKKPVRRFKPLAQTNESVFGNLGAVASNNVDKLNPFSFLSKPSIKPLNKEAEPQMDGISSTGNKLAVHTPFTFSMPQTTTVPETSVSEKIGNGGVVPKPVDKVNPFSFLGNQNNEPLNKDANPLITGHLSTDNKPAPHSLFTFSKPQTTTLSDLPTETSISGKISNVGVAAPMPVEKFNPFSFLGNQSNEPLSKVALSTKMLTSNNKPVLNKSFTLSNPQTTTSSNLPTEPLLSPSKSFLNAGSNIVNFQATPNANVIIKGDEIIGTPTSHLSAKLEELNKSFITLIQNEVLKKPTSILSKCFKDYISQVEKLYSTGTENLQVSEYPKSPSSGTFNKSLSVMRTYPSGLLTSPVGEKSNNSFSANQFSQGSKVESDGSIAAVFDSSKLNGGGVTKEKYISSLQ